MTGRRQTRGRPTITRRRAHIRSVALAKSGRSKIEWAEGQMPVLLKIRSRVARTKPLKGVRLACCLHVTTETAHLMLTLKAAGAQIALAASNPLSTQDDVAASLVKDYGMSVYAVRGENRTTYYDHIHEVLSLSPHITMDDGADLVSTSHKQPNRFGQDVFGGTEETTTGVIRLKSLDAQRQLRYPVIAVNDADTNPLFDNRYGTGQSTIDGILRATNRLLAGSIFVVAGYGWCGKGFAMRARGMGANVVVTEVDAIKALEAAMDGFRVMPMNDAAKIGDVFCTLTGDINVIDKHHFPLMKDGAILANSGHFDVEINVKELEKLSEKKTKDVRTNVDEYVINGKRLYLVGEGRLVNLAAAEGHPASVMDMSFATQALASAWVVENKGRLEPRVYDIDPVIEKRVADLKLASMHIGIDTLTPEQKKYLESWQEGT